MASTKARSPKVPQAPQRKHAGPPLRRRWLPLVVGAAIVLAAVAAFVVARGGSSGDGETVGLPHTSDYHSLLVSPTDPRQLILGTHQGLFRSTDAPATAGPPGLRSGDTHMTSLILGICALTCPLGCSE